MRKILFFSMISLAAASYEGCDCDSSTTSSGGAGGPVACDIGDACTSGAHTCVAGESRCSLTEDCCRGEIGCLQWCLPVSDSCGVCVYQHYQGGQCAEQGECSDGFICAPCVDMKSETMPYGIDCLVDWGVDAGTPVCYPDSQPGLDAGVP